MESIVAKLKYHDGDINGAVDSANKALTLLNQESVSSTPSFSKLEAIGDILK